MKFYCPECETRYEGEEYELCPDDGARLFRLDTPDDEGDPLIDTLVDERFRIQQLIGTGGMGAVYKALQLSVQREVALKVLRPELVDREVMLERFFREAKVVSELTHPNIVRLVDFGQDEQLDLLYLVMEMVEGTDLGELVDRGRLRPNMALEIVYQVCGGLTEPHNRGIVHRDLKPENLIMMPITDGTLQVKVLDFGIARALESGTQLTKTGMICGTPAYMSPEQAQDGELDGRTDLYSLGVMLFEMLTGKPPFSGESSLQILLKHVQQPAPDLGAITGEGAVPAPITDLVGDLMTKDPDRRPESARRVRDRIDEIRRKLDLEPVRLETDVDDQRAFEAWVSPPLSLDLSASRTGEREADISSEELARTLAPSSTGEIADGPDTGEFDEQSETELEYAVADTFASEPEGAGPGPALSDSTSDPKGPAAVESRSEPAPTEQSGAVETRDELNGADRPTHQTASTTPIRDIVTHPAVIGLTVLMFLTLGIVIGVGTFFVLSEDAEIPGLAQTEPSQQLDQQADFDQETDEPGDDPSDEPTEDGEIVAEADEPAPEPSTGDSEHEPTDEPSTADDEPAAEPPDEPGDDEEEPAEQFDDGFEETERHVEREIQEAERQMEREFEQAEQQFEEAEQQFEEEFGDTTGGASPPERLGDDEQPEDDSEPAEQQRDDTTETDEATEPDDDSPEEQEEADEPPAEPEQEEQQDEDKQQDEDDGDELRERLDQLRGD